MRPGVLIVDDSQTTGDLARIVLEPLPCEVEVAQEPEEALELASGRLAPWVMVVDPHLPGVEPLPFVVLLHAAAPSASLVLLIDRAAVAPPVPSVSASVYKPFQPRRFASLVGELLVSHESAAGEQGA